MDLFWAFFWPPLIQDPRKTVDPKEKGQRLVVVTERLGDFSSSIPGIETSPVIADTAHIA